MKRIDHLGTTSISGYQLSSSIGRIYIPKGVDRNSFVETCLRKGVCSVVRDNAYGVINNVKIGIEEIQLLEWPKESGKLGNTVLLLLDPFKKVYNVAAVLNNDGEILKAKEGVRIISKVSSKGSVTLTLDSNRPSIQLLVENGDIELISRGGKVKVTSDKEVLVNAPIIAHNKADQAMLRGDKTTELLEELIDLIAKAKVSTSIGLQPLTTALQISKLKSKLEELKSTKSYLE